MVLQGSGRTDLQHTLHIQDVGYDVGFACLQAVPVLLQLCYGLSGSTEISAQPWKLLSSLCLCLHGSFRGQRYSLTGVCWSLLIAITCTHTPPAHARYYNKASWKHSQHIELAACEGRRPHIARRTWRLSLCCLTCWSWRSASARAFSSAPSAARTSCNSFSAFRSCPFSSSASHTACSGLQDMAMGKVCDQMKALWVAPRTRNCAHMSVQLRAPAAYF